MGKGAATLMRTVSVAALLSPFGLLSACEAAPSALLGLTGSGSNLTLVAYSCRNEPRVTVELYEGSQPHFALHGQLSEKRLARVSMMPVGAGWTADQGTLQPLPGESYSLEMADGENRWLGGISTFTPRDLPDVDRGILITHVDKPAIVDQKEFVSEAEKHC